MEIIKSPNDNKEYKYVILPNNLVCLLISDPKTPYSGCSMAVGSGSFHDGDVAGLAHFVEHMLFMGNSKYPEEDVYQKFLSMHNGLSNAFTSDLITCYYFRIDPVYFEGALDIFSYFFKAPSFNPKSLEKEMNAVESEYRKNINADIWRTHEISKQFSNSHNVRQNFTIGSLTTLNRSDIRDKVKIFFDEHYFAENMRLVILGKEPIAQLELLLNMFKDIHNVPGKKIPHHLPKIFDRTNTMIQMVPVKDENKLILTWDVSMKKPFRDMKLISLVAYLFTVDSNNTFSQTLKSKQLAYDVSFGVEEDYDSRVILTMTIDMPKMSQEIVAEICGMFQTYIKQIRNHWTNSVEQLYGQLSYLKLLNFKYIERDDVTTYVNDLSVNMLKKYIPKKELLCYNYVLPPFDYIVSVELIDQLKFENCNIILSSHNFMNVTNEKEEWFDIEFTRSPKTIRVADIPICNLALTKPIKYFPSNLNIIPKTQQNSPRKVSTVPVDLWYYPNINDNTPYAMVCASIYVPEIFKNPLYDMLMNIYMFSINEYLIQTTAQLMFSGFTIECSYESECVSIVVKGYSEFVPSILQLLYRTLNMNISELPKLRTIIDNKIGKYQEELSNYIFTAPYVQCVELINSLMDAQYISNEAKVRLIDSITYNNVVTMRELYSKTPKKVICMVAGNMSESECLNVGHILSENEHQFANYDVEQMRSRIKTTSSNVQIESVKNSKERNSSILYGVNIGFQVNGYTENWDMMISLMNIVDNLISERFFNQLRTIEQLGYIARTSIMRIGSDMYPYYVNAFVVQSAIKKPDYIKERIDLFLKDAKKFLTDIEQSKYDELIASEIRTLENERENMFSKAIEMFGFIDSLGQDIDTKKKMVYAFKKITKNMIIEFYEKYYINGTKNIVGIAS